MWDIFDLCGGEKGWVAYHNNQRLRHHKVPVHHGDFFACYRRSDSNTPFQTDRIGSDAAMEAVHSEAAGSTVSAPLVPDAADSARHDDTATFEQTGDPLLLIGRVSGRSRGDTAEFLYLRSFQWGSGLRTLCMVLHRPKEFAVCFFCASVIVRLCYLLQCSHMVTIH